MKPIIIAGPCAAESKEQLFATASQLHHYFSEQGILPISFLRVGVWKAPSPPNSVKAIGKIAFPWLKEISETYNINVCVEIAKPKHVEICLANNINAVWIGSRTVVNPFDVQELAEAVAGTSLTVMIKNPIVPDLKLWIGAIERIEQAGVNQIMAIHRGFTASKEHVYRNKPLWELAIDLKVRYPDLPLICDPSHIAGHTKYIANIAQTALDYGFNGLMIETHCCPQYALSDAKQQMTPKQLATLLKTLTFKTLDSSPFEEQLRKQRHLIQEIDAQIAELLVKRMRVIDEIAKVKLEYNLPIVQPQQWNNVIERYKNNSLTDENYSYFLEKFLELLHQQSILRQQSIKKS